jgi:diacylglycerol kinase family enzyme
VKFQVIVNSAAGGGKGKRGFPTLVAKIKDLGWSADCFLSHHPQEALAIAIRAQSQGCDCLVVGGGDGTVHSLLPALVNRSLVLGVIPMGGANDLARNWGIPLDLDGALGVLCQGRTRAVDVIAARSGPYIAGAGGVGFDVAVIERASQWRHHWKGISPFFPAVALEFFRYRLPWISITGGDWQYRGPAWQVLFTKISRYALLLKIPSSVKIDDGLMEICLVPGVSKSLLLAHSPFFSFFGFKSLPEVRFFSAPEVAIESSPPLKYHGDGELIGQTPEVFRVLPRALKVIMPMARPDCISAEAPWPGRK